MAATQRFVGAQTPFGTITQVSNSVYNALATVQAKDGGTSKPKPSGKGGYRALGEDWPDYRI